MANYRLLIAFLLLGPGVMYSQPSLGSISGTVTDNTGARVPGAKIEATDLGTGTTSRTETTADGLYNLTGLVLGQYKIAIQKEGFETTVVGPLTVSAGQTTSAEVKLIVGSTSTTVNVAAQSPLLATSTTAVTMTAERELLQDLPYPEQSALGAALLVAGVRGDPSSPGQISSENPGIYQGYVVPGATLSVGGGFPGHSSILVDDSDVTQASYPRAGISVSSQVVQEVVVVTGGLPAQYGRTMGGVIVQATRSGNNSLHGTLMWRHTDPAIQAYPLFSSISAQEHQNFFGGYLGGPVYLPKLYKGRNRTFFFVAVEPARLSNDTGLQGVLPTPDELAGRLNNDLSLLNTTILRSSGAAAALAAPRTGNIYYRFPVNAAGFPVGVEYTNASQNVPIPNNDVSAQLGQNKFAQYVMSQFPTPQNPGPYVTFLQPNGLWLNNGNNVAYQRGVTNVDNRWSFRIDHSISEKDKIFLRVTGIPLTSGRIEGFPISSPVNPVPSDSAASQNFMLNESHVITPSMVNQFRVMYMRNHQLRAPDSAALTQDWASQYGLTPATSGAGFPALSLGYTYGLGVANGLEQVDENYQFADDLSWTRGNHTIKMGVDLRRLESNQYDLAGVYGGSYSFSTSSTSNGTSGGATLASFDLGLISSFSDTPVNVPAYYRWHYYAGYFQDDVKVRSNLTFNLGLRYNVETPRMEKYNNQGTFLPNITGTLNGMPATGAFCFSGSCGLPTSLWPTNYHGFEPRLGVAWVPKPFMTVRASYSMIRVPLSGYGNTPSPDFNVASYSIGGIAGGQVPNQGVSYITNPVGPLTSALSALQGHGPFFTVQGVGINVIQQNDITPYTQQWTVALQFQLRPKTMLQISYNGLKGTHLVGYYSPPWNQPTLATITSLIKQNFNFGTSYNNPYKIAQTPGGAVLSENAYQGLRPYQNFFNATLNELYNRQGDSIYHGLYISMTHRYSFGLSLMGSFAWSKSIDDVGGDPNTNNFIAGANQIQDIGNLHNERAPSIFDIPAKLTVGYTYELPIGSNKLLPIHNRVLEAVIGGWVTSGIVNRQSGYPFPAFLGGNGYWFDAAGGTAITNGTTGWYLRPNVVPGQACINPNWRQDPLNDSYINTSMFAVPGSLYNPVLGDAPSRLTNCRSPLLQTFDAQLNKRFRLGSDEKRYIQLGVNAINAFNHPVFFMGSSSAEHYVYSSFNTASLTNPSVPAFTIPATFGYLASANTSPMSRVVQLSVKVTW